MCIITLSVLGTALGVSIGTGVTAASVGAAVGGGTLAGLGIMAAEVIGVGASLVGGITSTVAGIQQAEQQAAVADFQAAVAEENAKIASQSAEANDLQANQKRLALLRQMQQMQGNIRTDFAGRGVVLGAGTPNDYEADLADAYDMDRRNLEYDVATKTWQYRVQASNSKQQAELYKAQAKAYRAGIPGIAAGGLLSTAGQLGTSMLGSFSLMKGLELGKTAETAATAGWGMGSSKAFGMVS